MPAPTDDDRYNPAAIFRNFDPQRPWYILVTEPGVQERVAERARPVGIDIYFPQAMCLQKRMVRGSKTLEGVTEVISPVWGRYVAAAVRADLFPNITIAHALGVRGVTELLGGEDGRPYSLPAKQIHEWWVRQTQGDLDDGIRVRRRLFPRWCRKGYPARIIGGMTTFFNKALEGIIVSLENPENIGIEVELMGRKSVIYAPLVFLEKAG